MENGTVEKGALEKFVLAGFSIFTVENCKTGGRFTFKVKQRKNEGPHFVAVLTGADNTVDFQFLGTIFDGETYRHGTKSGIGSDAQSAKVFDFFWKNRDRLPEQIEIYHMGRCGRCGRPLTVPESVRTGLGPKCRTM